MRSATLLAILSPVAVLAQSGYTPCTSTITELMPWGCTVAVGGATATATMDCQGCSLSTTTKVNGFLGLGPVCLGGRKTITDSKLIKTITGCAPGTGATHRKGGKAKDEVSDDLLLIEAVRFGFHADMFNSCEMNKYMGHRARIVRICRSR